jgi:leucyl-tRNA synthetase
MMSLINDIYDAGTLTRDELGIFVRILCPFAPHIAEEIWEMLGHEGFAALAQWPEWDEAKTVDATVTYAVQVNGKLRATLDLPKDMDKDSAIAAAKEEPKVIQFTEGKTVVKEIFVPGKIINIVVK